MKEVGLFVPHSFKSSESKISVAGFHLYSQRWRWRTTVVEYVQRKDPKASWESEGSTSQLGFSDQSFQENYLTVIHPWWPTALWTSPSKSPPSHYYQLWFWDSTICINLERTTVSPNHSTLYGVVLLSRCRKTWLGRFINLIIGMILERGRKGIRWGKDTNFHL